MKSKAARQARAVLFGLLLVLVLVPIGAAEDAEPTSVFGDQAGDFELLVDGEPQPVAYFSEIRDGEVLAESPTRTQTSREKPQPRAAADPGPIATHYLIFIDDFFAIGAHRNFALKKLQAQLSVLGPNDRVAVVAWNGKKLTARPPETWLPVGLR